MTTTTANNRAFLYSVAEQRARDLESCARQLAETLQRIGRETAQDGWKIPLYVVPDTLEAARLILADVARLVSDADRPYV